MRIALYHNLPSGGAKRALFEWTRRLADRHKIDVYSLNTADHKFCDIRPYASKHEVYDFTARRLFGTPFGRLNQFQRWRDLVDLEKLNQQIAKQINAGGYDVLFANTCGFTFIPLLLQHVEIPSAYYLHEPFGPGFFRQIWRPYFSSSNWREFLDRFDPLIPLYQRRLNSGQRRSMLRTKRLIANSRFTSQSNQAIFGQQAVVCPLGVDIIDFQPVNGCERENFVFSVGEMSARKGFDFIVESLGEIPTHDRPALKLACNIVHENELAYVKKLAEHKSVKLDVLVGLGIDDLRDLYNRARLVIYAPVLEPFGLVPLEAMACGTPVIGVREGGVQESVVHEVTGLLVDRDANQFSTAIQKLLANPDLAETYGRNAREYVSQNWTWERSVATLESHLEDCAFGYVGTKKSTLKEKVL